MESNIKQILKELYQQEKIENDLISIYSGMLEMGIVDCLADEQKEGFHKNLNTLIDDSERHKEIVENMINNYK